MKRILLFSIILLILFQNAGSWNWDTHEYLTRNAISILPREERKVFEAMEEEILEASILPDKLRDEGKDSVENHIYDPSTQKGNAPTAVAQWYMVLVNDLKEKRMEDASECAGMLAHYIQDVSIPLHTGGYVEEHLPIESYIAQSLDKIPLSVSEKDVFYVADPTVFAKEVAKESYADYELMVQGYRKDDLGILDILAKKHVNRSIIATASLFHSAIMDSGYLEGEKSNIGIFQKISRTLIGYLIILRKPLTILAIVLILLFYFWGRRR